MPWYIITYFIIFLFLAIAGILDDYSDRPPFWRLTIAIISEAVIAFLFISFWYPTYLPEEQLIIQVLFVLAVLWQIYSIYSDITFENPSGDNKDEQTSLKAMIIASSVSLLITLPAIIVAGIVVYQSIPAQ